jgi:tellurite resistance protein
MKKIPISASLFGMVLGLSGLGQAWRVAVKFWDVPPAIAEGLLLVSGLIWATLLVSYLLQVARHFETVRTEFRHPVQGSTPALLAISTLLISMAVIPYSRPLAWVLAVAGMSGHLIFSLWHTGILWQGGRKPLDTLPTMYLPTVAGNFTSAAALGALGHSDWGWLFLGDLPLNHSSSNAFGIQQRCLCRNAQRLGFSSHRLRFAPWLGWRLNQAVLTIGC